MLIGHNHADQLSLKVYRDIAPLEEEWRALEAGPLCSVHQTFDWCRIWLKHHSREPLVIVARYEPHGGHQQAAFILPLVIESRGPIRLARYIGARFSNLNFGAFSEPFLAYADRDIMLTVRNRIKSLPLGVDAIVLDRQPATWLGYTHPFLHWPRVENHNRSFQITLEGGIETALTRGNAKRRRKKVRKSERLLKEFGEFSYVRATDAAEAHTMLEAFFRQKALRFRVSGIPNIFEKPAVRAFFHELAEHSLEQDRKLLELQAIRLADGTLCALSALSRKDGHVICQLSSIETGPTERASPGELLFYHSIRDSCEAGDTLFDFGVGDEQFKRSWCDMHTTHYDTTIAITPLGGIAAMVAGQYVAVKRLAKSTPTTWRLAKSLRYLLKR